MNYNIECCDPFEESKENIWIKIEHLGRYLWARSIIQEKELTIVVDAACGTGYGSMILSDVASKVVGIDRNFAGIKSNYQRKNITYVKADLDDLDDVVTVSEMDAVVCFETIEHVRYPEKLLSMFASMLKEDGILILSYPNKEYEQFDEYGNNKDIYHLHVFEREEIDFMLKNAGFRIDRRLGQDIPNRVSSRIKELKPLGFDEDYFDKLIGTDATVVENLSVLFGWPCEGKTGESYSTIYICHKEHL